jgi:homoaconitase/3-isopropylmalate dehydratase large subunit
MLFSQHISTVKKGGTGAIVEYLVKALLLCQRTGKGTICNMGAEIGATTLHLVMMLQWVVIYVQQIEQMLLMRLTKWHHILLVIQKCMQPEAYFDPN